MAWKPLYVTLDQFKAYALRVSPADTIDDVEAGIALRAACDAIDDACRRQFGQSAELEERYYTPEWDLASRRYVVRVDDIAETGEGFSVKVDADDDGTYSTNVALADVRKMPLNAEANGRPWHRLLLAESVGPPAFEGSVMVTATFGWAAIPDAIKQATMLQAARFLKRREAVFGIVGSPDMGIGETRLLATLDADVAVALQPYRLSVTA